MTRSVKPRIERRLFAIVMIVVFVVASAFAAYRYIPKADIATSGCASDIAIAIDTTSNNASSNVFAGGHTYTEAFPEGLYGVTQTVNNFVNYFGSTNNSIPNPNLRAYLALGSFTNDIGYIPLTTNTNQVSATLTSLSLLPGSSNLEPGLWQAYAQLQQGRKNLPKQKRVVVMISPALDDFGSTVDVTNARNAAAALRNEVTLVGIQLGGYGYMNTLAVPTTTNFGATYYRANNTIDLTLILQALEGYICNAPGGETGGIIDIPPTPTNVPSPTLPPTPVTGVSLFVTGNKLRLRPGDSAELQYTIANNTSQTLSNVSVSQNLPGELARSDGASSFAISIGTLTPGQQVTRSVTVVRK